MFSGSVIDNLIETITQPEFYWQLLMVVACFPVTFVFYKVIKHLLYLKLDTDPEFEESNLSKVIAKYISPLFLPLLTIIVLSSAMSVFSRFYVDIFLFSALIKLNALFLFLRFIKVFFQNDLIANLRMTDDKGSFQPAAYSAVFKLQTAEKSAGDKTWHVYKPSISKMLDVSDEKDAAIYMMAQEFQKQVSAGSSKPKYEKVGETKSEEII